MTEAIKDGADPKKACDDVGINVRTFSRWKKENNRKDKRKGAEKKVYGAFTKEEEEKVLSVCNEKEYRNHNPKIIVPMLADKGIWVASERTMYRILKKHGQLTHRGKSKKPKMVKKPETQTITGPGQLWSWDITYIKRDIKGLYFYLYLFMDVWSRKIVASYVSPQETSEEAAMIMEGLSKKYNIEGLRLHSDNGSPMKGSTMLATLHDLGVLASFSRPRVSEDNPYSESLFKTMKYKDTYPKNFATIESAKDWINNFIEWYNKEHLHSQIGYVTPESRHEGNDLAILQTRQETYKKAKEQYPERWKNRSIRECFPNRTLDFLKSRVKKL